MGFQVREHKPWRIWVAALLLILLLVIMFLLGRAYQGFEVGQLRIIRDTLELRIDELEQRNARLIKENAQLQGSAKIENDAYQRANDSLVKLQQEILALREELVFYQGIVSPEQLALGINIQSFELKKKNSDGLYRYKLVLTKRGKSNQVVKGTIEFSVKGQQDGQSSDIPLAELKQDFEASDLKFSFRYFQVFEGDLLLADGFNPDEIELMIKPTTRKIKNFSESISWVQALAGGEN